MGISMVEQCPHTAYTNLQYYLLLLVLQQNTLQKQLKGGSLYFGLGYLEDSVHLLEGRMVE